MENKTCGECKHLCNHQIIGTCQRIGICTGSIPACSKFEPKAITNGDRIRQMSNEELSVLICNNLRAAIRKPEVVGVDYEQKLLDWLNAPRHKVR